MNLLRRSGASASLSMVRRFGRAEGCRGRRPPGPNLGCPCRRACRLSGRVRPDRRTWRRTGCARAEAPLFLAFGGSRRTAVRIVGAAGALRLAGTGGDRTWTGMRRWPAKIRHPECRRLPRFNGMGRCARARRPKGRLSDRRGRQGSPPVRGRSWRGGRARVELGALDALHHRGLPTEVAEARNRLFPTERKAGPAVRARARTAPIAPRSRTGARSPTADVPVVLRAHALPTDVGGAQHEAEAGRPLQSQRNLRLAVSHVCRVRAARPNSTSRSTATRMKFRPSECSKLKSRHAQSKGPVV